MDRRGKSEGREGEGGGMVKGISPDGHFQKSVLMDLERSVVVSSVDVHML